MPEVQLGGGQGRALGGRIQLERFVTRKVSWGGRGMRGRWGGTMDNFLLNKEEGVL